MTNGFLPAARACPSFYVWQAFALFSVLPAGRLVNSAPSTGFPPGSSDALPRQNVSSQSARAFPQLVPTSPVRRYRPTRGMEAWVVRSARSLPSSVIATRYSGNGRSADQHIPGAAGPARYARIKASHFIPREDSGTELAERMLSWQQAT